MQAIDRLRCVLLKKLRKPISSAVLDELVGKSWADNLRELQAEEGYRIFALMATDSEKTLAITLLSEIPRHSFEDTVQMNLREASNAGDCLRCYMCGAAAGEVDEYDPKRRIRLYVSRFLSTPPGENTLSDLRAICTTCREGAATLTSDRPSARKLLTQIRRAKGDDQMEVLKWLLRKFPKEARSTLDG